MWLRGHFGPSFHTTLTRAGHVKYTDLSTRDVQQPSAEWQIPIPAVDSIWRRFERGVDSLLHPNAGGFITICDTAVAADAPGAQVAAFRSRNRRSAVTQRECARKLKTATALQILRDFFSFVDEFGHLTGTSARWHKDHPGQQD